jgi:ligand-binding sensor domain-containing protein
MTVYQPEPDNPQSISDNMITTIYEDRAGTLWVGTRAGGLNKFNRSISIRLMHRKHESTKVQVSALP